MRVEYICHACLLIETDDVRIVTDPWFDGPAYCGQWNVFPKPVNTEVLNNADVILISHGHEDHLHERSLRKLSKRARVFYPYSWFGGTKSYLQGLGFDDVQEAVNLKTYKLTKKTSVTFIANTHDNLIVIESDGKVLVNANDALHAYSVSVIDFYINIVRKRWPRIDALFCGFGGASFFPNTVHLDGKDDFGVAQLREQFFAHNFCRIVAGLKPAVAVPFAADFTLLAPEQRWINDVRFPRSRMRDYYRSFFVNGNEESDIHDMYPGDILENDKLLAASPYRQQLENGGLNHLIDDQYKEEISQLQQMEFIPEADASRLSEEIRRNIDSRINLLGAEQLNKLKFCIRVSDVADNNSFNITISDGQAQVQRSDEPDSESLLIIDSSSRILRCSLGSEWGGDVLYIGYGCDLRLLNPRAVKSNLDALCINLLSRYPTVRGYFKKNPLRVLKHTLHPLSHTLRLRSLKPHLTEGVNLDRSIWLLSSKDEIRRLCGLPLINEFIF